MQKKVVRLTYQARIPYCLNPMAQRLLTIMEEKKTNLCLSADVTHINDLLTLVDRVGEMICLLKTHVDILTDFNPDFTTQLKALAKRHNFLIFEDRKFADIGYTVKQQYQGGLYRIAEWADIINAHTVPGPGIIQGLREVGLVKQRGLLLLAEMSSLGSLAHDAYTQASIAMAGPYLDFVMGFIARKRYDASPQFIYMTPGIKWEQAQDDGLGQQYLAPEQAIREGTDIIIVGRGIYQAKDQRAAANRYRESAWQTYLSCC